MADFPFSNLIGQGSGGTTPFGLDLNKALIEQLGKRVGPAYEGPGAWWGHAVDSGNRMAQWQLMQKSVAQELAGRAGGASALSGAYAPFLNGTPNATPGSSSSLSPNPSAASLPGMGADGNLTTGSLQPSDSNATPGSTRASPFPGQPIDVSKYSGIGFPHGQMSGVNGLVLHFTGDHHSNEQGIEDAKTFNPAANTTVGAQYRMDRQGQVWRIAPTGARMYHIIPGSGPMGQGLSNNNMEGIEIAATGNNDLTDAQKAALMPFLRWHSNAYGYDPTQNIRSHGEVNPGHRSDPRNPMGGEMTPIAYAARQAFANPQLVSGPQQVQRMNLGMGGQQPGQPSPAGGGAAPPAQGSPAGPQAGPRFAQATGQPGVQGAAPDATSPATSGLPIPLQNPVGQVSPQQLQAILANPWIAPEQKTNILQMIQTRGTPQFLDVEGGKLMYSPANPTQRVFIPEPKFGTLKMGGNDIPIVSRFDPDTKRWESVPMTPSSGGQPGEQPGQGQGAPPGGKQFGAIDYSPSGLLNLEQTQKAAVKGAEDTASKLAQARAAPVASAIDKASSSAKSVNLLNTLETIDKLPATKNIHTGPFADEWLNVGRAVNDFTGLNIFNKDTLSSAELIKKLGTQLASSAARELTNRPTQFDFRQFLAANPGLENTPQGRRMLINVLRQAAQQDIQLGDVATGLDDPKQWPKLRDQVYKNSPITVTYGGKQINSADPISSPINPNPQPGYIRNGYRFKGGNRSDPRSWEKVNPNAGQEWQLSPG